MQHTPVLLHETIDGLTLEPGFTVVDATLGLGGHSAAILAKIGSHGVLVGIELDHNARTHAEKRLENYAATKHLIQGSFVELNQILRTLNIDSVHAVLFDLGWNSSQLEAGRGFSFMKDEPLLMTLRSDIDEDTITAAHVVNTWSTKDLRETIGTLGEESFAGRIAEAIVAERKNGPIETSGRLAEIVESAVPVWYRNKKTHPATKTFQALRIVVNDELSSITTGVQAAFERLAPKGRIAIITFHSLEDGLVKRLFKSLEKEHNAHIITKKPITPTREETQSNPRARSAKLRIIEKHA